MQNGRLRPVVGLVLLLVIAMLPVALHGQPGQSLGGRVTRPDGSPAAHARVQVTAASGETVAVGVDSAGAYRLRLPAAGPYLVSVDAPGLSSATRVLPADAPPAADFTLAERTVVLAPVAVRIQPLTVGTATRHVPGSREQSRLAVSLREEPLDADFLADVAARQVGVSAGPDGLSVSGQPASQTLLTLDGMEAGSAGVPREAVRAVNLLTSTYDVARGRFTGGQLDVQTLRAGNEWGSTLRVASQGSALEYGGSPGTLGDRSSYVALDAGGGGALLRDRLFTYNAVSARRTAAESPWLTDLDPDALRRLGLEPDSVERFLALTGASRPPADAASRTVSRTLSALTRLDAVLSPRQALTLRLNGAWADLPDRDRALALPGTESATHSSSTGLFAQLSSGGRRVANELRLGMGATSHEASAADAFPEGLLMFERAGDLAQRGGGMLRFAGSPLGAFETRERTLELADQVVATTPGEAHRFRLGGELALQRYDRVSSPAAGTFVFETLDDLRQGRPAYFTRSLAPPDLEADIRRITVFADDHWRPGALQLSYGVRAERVWSPAPTRNPAVEARFGSGGRGMPSRWELSPRVGFGFTTRMPWDHGPQGRTSVSGGFGRFVGVLPLPTLSTALTETGEAEAGDVVCAGDAVPVPDWAAYRTDASSVPDSCADGSSPVSSRLPRATIFSRDFAPPTVWRASVGGQGVLKSGIVWNVSGAMLWGVRQPAAFDRNLRDSPAFRIAEEGGRPVFVSPEAVDPETGLVSLTASRRYPELGIVREATGDGRSQTVQLSASASQVFVSPVLGWAMADLGYTWTAGREQVGSVPAPGGPSSATAGDPARLEWAPAGHAPRHILQAYAGTSPTTRLWIGLTAVFSSGRAFTPTVAGDVNGDGLHNDRAFIFDSRTDRGDEVGVGIDRLLKEAPAGARRCLRAQLGRVGGANSCRTGWSQSLDLNLRYQFGPTIEGSPRRRATLWVVASNVPAGLDYLVNGPDGLKGWGQPPFVDNRLLSVRGFDPGSRRFQYDVNPGFGRPRSLSDLSRSPFSVSVQVRLVLGTDRALRDFRRQLAAGRTNADAFAPANVRLHAERQLPNIPAEALAMNGQAGLLLTPAQALRLQAAADSLAPGIEAVLAEVVASVSNEGNAPRLTAARASELQLQAGSLRAEGLSAVRAILTPEQWTRLPPALRAEQVRFSPYPPEEFSGMPN
jgi:hypothetical protein